MNIIGKYIYVQLKYCNNNKHDIIQVIPVTRVFIAFYMYVLIYL